MQPYNCLFAYPDRTLTSTIAKKSTSADWAITLDNLKDRLRSKTARSASAAEANTVFDIAIANGNSVRVVAIANHNMSASATVKLYFGTTLGASDLLITDDLPVWGQFYPDGSVEWEEVEFWNLELDAEEVSNYSPSPDFWYVTPSNIAPAFIRVEIKDSTNAAGYIELGRCICAPAFQPDLNLDYGAAMAWQQDVIEDQSLGGTKWFEIMSQGREISGTLGMLSIAEGMVNIFDRQRRLGKEGELYFIFDPTDSVLLYKQRAMLCRHANEDPLQYPFFDKTSGSFTLQEVR